MIHLWPTKPRPKSSRDLQTRNMTSHTKAQAMKARGGVAQKE